MSNHHLRNVALSLKAKGLLSLMLSLPDNWDYTTKGLAHICKDGVDSISSAIKELEKQGYLTRRRLRDYHGSKTGKSKTGKTCFGGKPEQENPAQLNIIHQLTKKSKTINQ